jgi:hypothetical protein
MTDTSSLICVHDNLVERSLMVDCESMVAGFIGDHVIVAKLQLRHGGQRVTSMLLLHIPLSLNSLQTDHISNTMILAHVYRLPPSLFMY